MYHAFPSCHMFYGFLLGLYHSDLYNDDNAVVAEAVRRLPEHVYEARVHRMHRAMQLSRNKIILPESMWPKEDEVSPFFFLW